jgi:hypothetical protein
LLRTLTAVGSEKIKVVILVVELDNIRIELSSFEKPLLEVRDSL